MVFATCIHVLCAGRTCDCECFVTFLKLTEPDSVSEGDAVFVVKLQDYTATEKDEVSLDCELSKDVPVVWYHNEIEITASKMVVMKSEGLHRTLVLKKVEQSDKGKYICDCGTDKTSATINIEGKPENLSHHSQILKSTEKD